MLLHARKRLRGLFGSDSLLTALGFGEARLWPRAEVVCWRKHAIIDVNNGVGATVSEMPVGKRLCRASMVTHFACLALSGPRLVTVPRRESYRIAQPLKDIL